MLNISQVKLQVNTRTA